MKRFLLILLVCASLAFMDDQKPATLKFLPTYSFSVNTTDSVIWMYGGNGRWFEFNVKAPWYAKMVLNLDTVIVPVQPKDTLNLTIYKLNKDSVIASGYITNWRFRHNLDSVLRNYYKKAQVDSLLNFKRNLNNHDSLSMLDERRYQSLTDTLLWGLGLVQLGHTVKIDTSHASILSRERAANTYALKNHSQAQSTITGLSDSLLARYTKTQADGRFAPISHSQAISTITHLADSLLARYTKTQADARFAPLSHSQSIPTITGLQDSLTAKELKKYKVTTISASSNNVQYPTAKAVYDNLVSARQHTDSINTTTTGKKPYHGIETIGGISFNNSTHVFTVASGGLTYWNQGYKHHSTTAKTVDLDDITLETNKLFYIYFSDTTGVLRASKTPWNFKLHTFVATVYWNGSAGAIQDEDHNYTRDLDWHYWSHSSVGTRYAGSGLDKTSPTISSGGALSISAGGIIDEDHQITIGTQTTMRGWYQASSGVYTFSDYSLPYLGTIGAPQYLNTNNYALTTTTNNNWICYWVYASNDIDKPIYVIPTHAATAYNTVALARAETQPNLKDIPINGEMKVIWKFIYKGDGTFEEAVDYRNSSTLPQGGSSSTNASAVSFLPYGTITQTTVQKALEQFNDSVFKNMSQYYVPKYNDKDFIKSKIYDNGKVHINGSAPDSMLTVTGGGKFTHGIKITAPQGESPLAVGSTTLITNLNSDLLDGQHGAYWARYGWADSTFIHNQHAAAQTASQWISGDAYFGGTNVNSFRFYTNYSGGNAGINLYNSGGVESFSHNSNTGLLYNKGQIQSATVTGNPPFVVASTTAVTNLNSDLLDGQHGSYYQVAGNYAPASGSANYIQNQGSSAQTANFWVSGVGGMANTYVGEDGTYGSTYNTIGFGGRTNGYNRIFAGLNTSDGLYIASATGRGISFRVNGGTSDNLSIASSGAATFSSTVSATQFQSTISTGTTPLTVASTTKVSNLNAEYWNSYKINGGAWVASTDRLLSYDLSNAEWRPIDATQIKTLLGLSSAVTGSGTSGYLPKWTGQYTQGDSPVYTDGTKVGIGGTTTSQLLTLYSTGYQLRLDNGGELGVIGVASTGELNFWSHGDNATDAIRFLTGSGSGNEVVRIANNGFFGLGTVSPASLLHLNSPSPIITLSRSDNASSPAAQINFKATTTTKWQIATNNGVGTGLEINQGDGTNTRMYIEPTYGNIGIGGVISPAEKLSLPSGAGIGLGSAANNGGTYIKFQGSNTNKNWLVGNQWNGAYFEITPSTATGGTTFSTPTIVINDALDIGVGTVSPQYKLDVVGTINASTTISTRADNTFLFSRATTASAAQYQSWYNSANTRRGYFGYASGGSDVITLENETGGAFSINPSGGKVVINAATANNSLNINGGGVYLATGTPSNTSYALYNNGGTLTWNGAALATGSSVSGTTNYIPKFTSASALGNSNMVDDGSAISSAITFNVINTKWIQGNSGNMLLGEGTNTYLQASGAGDIIFRNNTPTELARLLANGNFGLGCSPASKVEINPGRVTTLGAVSSSGIHIGYPTDAQVGDLGQITLGYRNAYAPTVISAIVTDNSVYGKADLIFGTRTSTSDVAPSERMRITSAGLVGFGTTNPQSLVHLSAANPFLQFTNTSTGGSGVYWYDTAGDSYVAHAYGTDAIITGSVAGDLAVRSNGKNILLSTNSGSSAQVYLKNGGKTGFNISSPANTIDVDGGGIHITSGTPSSTTYALYNNAGTLTWNGAALATGSSLSGTQNKVAKFTSGNSVGDSQIFDDGTYVGIGTVAPVYNLHINSAGDSRLHLTDSNQGVLGSDGLYLRQTGVNSMLVNQENGTLQIGTNNSYVMTMLADGNVGIGTTNPGSYKLYVNGAFASKVTRSFTHNGYGTVAIKSDDGGGWANTYSFIGSADTNVGGFGALGSNDALSYFYIGAAYNSYYMSLSSSGVNIPSLTASKLVFTDASKNLTSTGIGTSSQFIKGDGSLDGTTYVSGTPWTSMGYVTGTPWTSVGYWYASSHPTTLSGYGITDAVGSGDSRLTDARTPTSHVHGNITNAGAIGSTASLPVITTTSGVLTTGAFGTSSGQFAEGNHTHDYSAVFQPKATVLTNTTASFTSALETKLNGIAAGATNVTNTNQLTNGAGFLTEVTAGSGNYIQNQVSGTQTAGFKINGDATASKFTSTISQGNAPLAVTSNTKVDNLNADLLDNMHAASFVTGTPWRNEGYLTSGDLSSYATQSWVSSQGFASASSLSSYRLLSNGSFSVAISGTSASFSSSVSASNFCGSSDIRLKTNIKPISKEDFERISKIDFVKYNMKNDLGQLRYGAIADDLLKVAPEFVIVPADPKEMKTVLYIDLLVAKIAQMEEEKKQTNDLLKSLEARIKKLENEK